MPRDTVKEMLMNAGCWNQANNDEGSPKSECPRANGLSFNHWNLVIDSAFGILVSSFRMNLIQSALP